MDKEHTAMERLRLASDMSLRLYKQPLMLTDSGGKDSAVICRLAENAGIPFEIVHNHTTADAPETVYHVRKRAKEYEGKEFYSPEQDGLAQEWTGVCWCNPPYGREIGKWVRKAAESRCTVVMLLPARTDTKWFHDYIYGKAEIRFIKGRLKFGDAKNSAPFPSMVVIFKRESEKGNRI